MKKNLFDFDKSKAEVVAFVDQLAVDLDLDSSQENVRATLEIIKCYSASSHVLENVFRIFGKGNFDIFKKQDEVISDIVLTYKASKSAF